MRNGPPNIPPAGGAEQAPRLIPQGHVEQLARAVAALRDEYEFRTFWLGVRLRGPITPAAAIATKSALSRRVALRVFELRPDLDSTPERPDANVLLHYPELAVSIRPRSLLVYGRYRKLSREIPQSRWHCRRCRGRGCELCSGTGRRFARTIEELLAAPFLRVTGGRGSRFHSTGREDVDVRTLGRGRPFVLEILEPRRRSVDLPALQEEVNRTCRDYFEVRELRYATPALKDLVNTIVADKSYRAVVTCLAPAPAQKVEALGRLRDLEIAQETPRRVLHRRANKVRRRIVRHIETALPARSGGAVKTFEMALRTEAGTYIKEFISGDEGRTHPSVAWLLGVPCDCAELDVIEVHCDPAAEATPSPRGSGAATSR